MCKHGNSAKLFSITVNVRLGFLRRTCKYSVYDENLGYLKNVHYKLEKTGNNVMFFFLTKDGKNALV